MFDFAKLLATNLYNDLSCLIIETQKNQSKFEASLLGGLEPSTFRLTAARASQMLHNSCSLVPRNYSR